MSKRKQTDNEILHLIERAILSPGRRAELLADAQAAATALDPRIKLTPRVKKGLEALDTNLDLAATALAKDVTLRTSILASQLIEDTVALTTPGKPKDVVQKLGLIAKTKTQQSSGK